MHFWSVLAEHFWFARTPFLLLTYICVDALARRANVERAHQRVALSLLVGHAIATTIGAAQDAYDYEDQIADTVQLMFGLLSFLALGITAMFRVGLPRVGLPLPRILIDIFAAIGVLIVMIVVGKRAGFSVAGLITTSAVLTAVIGFSLQDTLGNVMGGLSVQLDKSIKVGDWVKLGPGLPTGRITEIRWRYTAVETRDWDTVIVPNGTLVKSQITIVGKRTGEPVQTRRTVDFFVDFRTPPTEVIEAVEAALRRNPTPRMAATPAPHVLFFGVKESYGHYIARYWLTDLSVDDLPDSAVRVRIWYALQRAGIAFSIPASAVFLTPMTPERQVAKAHAELDRRMLALSSVDLFRGLSVEKRQELAQLLVWKPFASGEAVTREGEHDDGLYMIVEGEGSVRIGKGDEEHEVARLRAGQFFGEMSLMTGEVRTASVVAASELLCYRIDKPAFQQMLRELPGLADQIAERLAERKTALDAMRDELENEAGKKKRAETAKQDLLERIRGFFGME